jgi:hypothetical protein
VQLKTENLAWLAGQRNDCWIVGNHLTNKFVVMAGNKSMRVKMMVATLMVAAGIARALANYAPDGGEYPIAGTLSEDQVYPHLSIKTTGGYLVWQDNITDGDGFGISARRLDSSFSGTLSSFRVNTNAVADQERPQVSVLGGGGAIFVWQGGKMSFQHIYARVLSAAGVWVTGDIRVNTATNVYQREPVVATLGNGNAVVAWNSMNQAGAGSLQDVYFQILTPAGDAVGIETRANATTAYNQRSVAVASLSDGRWVLVWVSEQQRFENSTDVFARIFNANGSAATGEFLVNSGTNVCANPSVAPSADGGFVVAWMERNPQLPSNGWDIHARPFSGTFGGVTRILNTHTYGDQLAPKTSNIGSDTLVVWTSLNQDGSWEGVYGRVLSGDGTPQGDEFRVNTTTPSQQMHPAVASDGVASFVAVWTSFGGSPAGFDLRAQRYLNTSQPLVAPGAPFVTVLSSSALGVSWPPVQGLAVSNYQVYADGAALPAVTVTNTYWNATNLSAASTHRYQVAYVVADGRRSPLSGATTNTTYAAWPSWGGIPQEWMMGYFGNDSFIWPSPFLDTDGDGVSNKDEFLAGTDPTDANSVLKVRLQPTAQGLFLNWNTQPGLMYQVQQASSIGAWMELGAPRFAPGTVDSMYVGGGAAAYYRIVRLR